MRLILAAALPSKSLWYLTRGSGAVSLLLLTASLVLGVVTSVGAATESLPRFVVQALHRNISLLVTVFSAIHVATSVADSFVPITWVDALVPLHASYRPLWTGLGALAFDLLLALVITSLVRARIGLRAWRLAGHTPAHEARWAAVGNRVMSTPISAMMHSAARLSTPMIVSSRSWASLKGRSRGRSRCRCDGIQAGPYFADLDEINVCACACGSSARDECWRNAATIRPPVSR